MPAEQAAAELTTRDVLLQVDRRLSLIEGDLRGLDEKLDDKIDGLRSELAAQNSDLRNEMNIRFDRANIRIDEVYTKLEAKIDTRFYWTLGTLVTLTGLVAAVVKL